MSNFNVLFTLSNAQMLLSKTLKSRECNADVHSSDNKPLLPLLNHSIYFSPLWWQNMIILIIIPEDLFGVCPPIYRLLLEMSRFDKWWFWNGFVWASRTNRGATWTTWRVAEEAARQESHWEDGCAEELLVTQVATTTGNGRQASVRDVLLAAPPAPSVFTYFLSGTLIWADTLWQTRQEMHDPISVPPDRKRCALLQQFVFFSFSFSLIFFFLPQQSDTIWL